MVDLDRFKTEGDSKYNSSLDILQRMNRLIETAEASSFRHDLVGMEQWRDAIAGMQRQIIPYCKQAEIDSLRKHEVKMIPNSMLVRKHNISVNMPHLRKRLDAWEVEVLCMIAKKGMGLKSSNDPRRAV